MMKKQMTICMTGLLAWMTTVSAKPLEDFEPGTSYSGPGTIQVDPDDAANKVLLLVGGEVTTFIPSAFRGTVTV